MKKAFVRPVEVEAIQLGVKVPVSKCCLAASPAERAKAWTDRKKEEKRKTEIFTENNRFKRRIKDPLNFRPGTAIKQNP
jgi:hypothetical protein